MSFKFYCLVLIFIQIFNHSVFATYHKEVSTYIDASTSIVRVQHDIKVNEIIKKEYKIIFPYELSTHLAFLSVTSKGKTLPYTAPVTDDQNVTTFSVSISNTSAALKVTAVFTNILEPYPAEIIQLENQLVRFKTSAYFYSPYKTESQKLTIKLFGSAIESFTKVLPASSKGSTISYGPYKNIDELQYEPIVVHYVNNFPFARMSVMTKEVEVSHWGNIAIEEMYELQHAGAKLKGGFSRFDYQARRGQSSPSFRNLITMLPAKANNIYYRDQIGNISHSDIRVDDNELELEILTRFPLFGGWQTQFYLGYSIPTELALSIDTDDRYNLKFDFFTGFENVWVEDIEMKVILPEGSTDIKVDVPYPVEQSQTVRFTYLDSELNGGRPVIILKARNLVEEHDQKVHVSYAFKKSRMIVEPIMLIIFFFSFFVLCSLLSRANFSRATEKSGRETVPPPPSSAVATENTKLNSTLTK